MRKRRIILYKSLLFLFKVPDWIDGDMCGRIICMILCFSVCCVG